VAGSHDVNDEPNQNNPVITVREPHSSQYVEVVRTM
jgi:hypothetical protein